MPAQFWESMINSPAPVVSGTALASSTSLTTISPSTTTSPDFVVPANWLYVGQCLRVTGTGQFSTTGTPTLLIGAYWGGSAGVSLAGSGTVTTTNNSTNITWVFQMQMFVRSIGTSGTAMCVGHVQGLGGAATTPALVPATAPAVATIDTTAAKALVLAAQWGTNSASNTITCHTWSIEAMN